MAILHEHILTVSALRIPVRNTQQTLIHTHTLDDFVSASPTNTTVFRSVLQIYSFLTV